MYRMFLLSIRTLNGLNKVNLAKSFTPDPAAQLIRSITWTKDGMAYSLLFLESVKSVDAEFYKDIMWGL